MNHTVTVTRSMHGDLRAENDIPMSQPGRVLTIRTGKHGRSLITRATSCVVKNEGGWESRTHELFGDFSKVVAQSTARATEKAIAAQQAAVLARADAILAEAEAFYAAKAAKKAQDDTTSPAQRNADDSSAGVDDGELATTPGYNC